MDRTAWCSTFLKTAPRLNDRSQDVYLSSSCLRRSSSSWSFPSASWSRAMVRSLSAVLCEAWASCRLHWPLRSSISRCILRGRASAWIGKCHRMRLVTGSLPWLVTPPGRRSTLQGRLQVMIASCGVTHWSCHWFPAYVSPWHS